MLYFKTGGAGNIEYRNIEKISNIWSLWSQQMRYFIKPSPNLT